MATRLELRGGSWWVWETSDLLGARYCLGVETFDEAQRVLAWEGESCMFLRNAEDALLAEYQIQHRPERIVRNARRIFGNLRKFLAVERRVRSLEDIGTEVLTKYARWRLEDHASGTVHYELAIIRRALQILCDWGHVARVPKMPRVPPSPPRQGFVTDEQLDQICQFLPGPVVPLVRFLSLTGWRTGEAQTLTWASVDFGIGVVRLEPGTTKNRDGREFPFRYLPPLEVLLRRQREEVTRLEVYLQKVIPWVFCRRHGGPIVRYDHGFRAACRKAGCPGHVPHDLRRSAVRRIDLAGVPRSVGMKLTGHRSERVYRAYATMGPQDMEDGVRKLAAYMARRSLPPVAQPEGGQ